MKEKYCNVSKWKMFIICLLPLLVVTLPEIYIQTEMEGGELKLKVTENRNWHTFAKHATAKDGLLFVLLLMKKIMEN